MRAGSGKLCAKRRAQVGKAPAAETTPKCRPKDCDQDRGEAGRKKKGPGPRKAVRMLPRS